jgi:hypothetical protein
MTSTTIIMMRVMLNEIQCPTVRPVWDLRAFTAALLAPLVTAEIRDASSAGQHHAPMRAGMEKAKAHTEMHIERDSALAAASAASSLTRTPETMSPSALARSGSFRSACWELMASGVNKKEVGVPKQKTGGQVGPRQAPVLPANTKIS